MSRFGPTVRRTLPAAAAAATMLAAPAPQPAQGATWTTLSPALHNAFIELGRTGRNPSFDKFNVRRHVLWHRVPYVTTGTTGPTSLDFFNANAAVGVTNIPQQGRLDTETAFWVQYIRVGILTGVDAAGASQAAGAQIVAGLTSVPVAEALRTIIQNGTLSVRVGERDLLGPGGVYGLNNFPTGSNFYADVALETTATTTTAYAVNCTNGLPHANNGFACTPWFPILPNKRISGNIVWPGGITTPANTNISIVLGLEGLYISPANL